MQLKLDPEQFEKYQEIFIKEITQTIMVKLVEAGLEGQQLEDATAGVAFSVASIIDDMSGIEFNGLEVNPYLTFRAKENEIVHCGENAYTYEFVMPVMKKLFNR